MKKIIVMIIVVIMVSCFGCSNGNISAHEDEFTSLDEILGAIKDKIDSPLRDIQKSHDEVLLALGSTVESFNKNSSLLEEWYDKSNVLSESAFTDVENLAIDYYRFIVAHLGISDQKATIDYMNNLRSIIEEKYQEFRDSIELMHKDIYDHFLDIVYDDENIEYMLIDKRYDSVGLIRENSFSSFERFYENHINVYECFISDKSTNIDEYIVIRDD